MTKELLGNFIAQQRKALGMTQKDLAERLHITDKAVSKWERGLSYPDVTLLEPLADIFGLGVEELVGCRETRSGEERAVDVVLDISRESLRCQRVEGRRRIIGILVLLFLTGLLVLYGSLIGRAIHEENTVFWVETIGNEHYVYLEKEEHLLKLQCKEADIQRIREDKENPAVGSGEQIYYMDYTWNKRTYKGTLHAFEKSDLIALGGLADAEFAPDDACIFGEYGYLYRPENYYRNPYGEGFLCDYRFWYYTESWEDPLLLVRDCLNAAVGDTDSDGENEIIVRTYYVEKPYVIYDDTNGFIEPTYVDDIPGEFKEQLICIWER